jgi:hypothetical protein
VEALEVYVRREYEEMADIFTLSEYPEFEDNEVVDETLTAENDPYGFERKEIENRIQLMEKDTFTLDRRSLKFMR